MRSAIAIVAFAATFVAAAPNVVEPRATGAPDGYALAKGVCFDAGDCLVSNFDIKNPGGFPKCQGGKCYTTVTGKAASTKKSTKTKKGSATPKDTDAPAGYAKASGSVCFDAFDCIGKGPLGKAKCIKFAC